jgi:hypothetical protein
MSAKGLNGDDDGDDDDDASKAADDVRKGPSSRNAGGQPFPPASYHLSRDEAWIKHNFVSFIDDFDDQHTQLTRLIEPRYYARANPFDGHVSTGREPTIDDVAPPPPSYGPMAAMLAWNRLPARIVVGTLAYFAFPVLIGFLESMTSVDSVVVPTPENVGLAEQFHDLFFPSQAVSRSISVSKEERDNLATLVNLYVPAVSIVLGTYISMTLNILYERFSRLQQTVSLEASMLAYCLQLLLDLFEQDEEHLVASSQCIADQIHVLVRESRGRETMRIIYNDPYAEILRIIQTFTHQTDRYKDRHGPLVALIRNSVRELFDLRSKRLSDEALALAPTHFDVMTFLSGLLLVGTALGTVATAQTDGVPTEVSRILFSALVVCYTTIYEMSYDLNRPFDGIYQLRRSGAAMHFLQIKQMVATHPMLKDSVLIIATATTTTTT